MTFTGFMMPMLGAGIVALEARRATEMQEVFRFIEREFRAAIDSIGLDVARTFQSVEVVRVAQDLSYRIDIQLSEDRTLGIRFDERMVEVCGGLFGEAYPIRGQLTTLWWRCYEDATVEVHEREWRDEVRRLTESGASWEQILRAQQRAQMTLEHIQRYHAAPPTIVRRPGEDWDVVSPDAVVGPQMTATEVQARVAEEALAFQRVRHSHYHRMVDPPIMGVMGQPRWLDVGFDPAVKERARALLVGGLSAAQREQYEAHQWFIVHGSEGGVFKIKYGRQMNIEQLHPKSMTRKWGLCFLPEGGLVEEDCMLAQKIALETDERGALKIANRFR